jgi:hypothetical protein
MTVKQKEIKIVPAGVLSTSCDNIQSVMVQTASDSLVNWGGFLFHCAYVR